MVHVRPIEAAERGPEDEEFGQDPHQKRDQEIQVRDHRWRAMAGALLKNAEGRLSTLTTGTAGLWSAGRVESASMPGKQARVLCPVCAEPMPPDETECANCGAFVIDEAVVRLSRAFGLDREKALKLFEAGFRHTKQLRDRDPNGVLEKGEVGLLFICTNCGGFVASGDTTCPRCAAEFETEPTVEDMEEDILDLRLCPICGADNDPELEECEVCGGPLRETKEPSPVAATERPSTPQTTTPRPVRRVLDNVDEFLRDPRPL